MAIKSARRALRLGATLTLLSLAWALPLKATAAVIESLGWDGDGERVTLEVRLQGSAEYERTVLEKGRKLRVTFRDTSLAADAVDIAGQGNVKGVFPFVADNGRDTNVDILLRETGNLEIERTANGVLIHTAALGAEAAAAPAAVATPAQSVAGASEEFMDEPAPAAAGLAAVGTPAQSVADASEQSMDEPAPAAAANVPTEAPVVQLAQIGEPEASAGDAAADAAQSNEAAPLIQLAQADTGNALRDVTFSALPGGRVQIDLSMTRRPEQPGSFSTTRPPRLALDFFNTTSVLAENVVKVGVGAVESIVAVEAGDRTRVVLNLLRSVSYETQITDDGFTLVVGSPAADAVTATTTKTRVFAPPAERPAKHSINRVDFRRSPEGAGRVVVDLSDPTVAVDIREEAGEILIDFVDTALPEELERRLDVVDFATPVQTIDAFRQGDHTRLVVSPTGNYQQSSYQAGNQFTLTVAPIVEGEEEERVDEFGYSGERLSLNFQRISVRAALQVIADFTGLNFVTSDSVAGNLTLRLQDVPWDQALDIILQTKGLAMRQKGNVVWVAPAGEIAALERQALEANKQVRELEPLVSELIQINYAKADDIANILRSVKAVDTGIQQSLFGSVSVGQIETESNTLLSPRGNVTVDDRTNTLLIQDTAEKISEVRKLIGLLDKPVRQVLIETRIVEANDDFAREVGVRLGFNRITTDARFPGSDAIIGDSFVSGSIEGTTAISGIGTDALPDSGIDVGNGLQVNLPAAGLEGADPVGYAIRIAKLGEGFAHLIDLELSALEAEGRGKVIASPRLITNDQQQAKIEQGQERIFTTNVLGVGSVVTKKAVLGMEVTPQITPDDRVVLDVYITKDRFVSPTDPTIDTKQIDTQVLLDNGETVVIGGIFQEDIGDEIVKTPVLGDIPLLGVLFRKKTRFHFRSELLIFLTPRIINPALNVR